MGGPLLEALLGVPTGATGQIVSLLHWLSDSLLFDPPLSSAGGDWSREMDIAWVCFLGRWYTPLGDWH